MARKGKASKGSRMWLQKLVNDCPEVLNGEIARRVSIPTQTIRWHSPLRENEYAECNTQEILGVMKGFGVRLERRSLDSFWPTVGAEWDGFGTADADHKTILLVESKSHIQETISSCKSTGRVNLSLIRGSLDETKRHIHRVSELPIDWTTGAYQYANRLAHLYLFACLNKLNAFLVLVYFLNDTDMEKGDSFVPQTAREWKSTIIQRDRMMGIRQRHPLSDRIVHAFIDVNDIKAR